MTDTFVHYYPTVQGDLVFTTTHVGAWLLNTGSRAIITTENPKAIVLGKWGFLPGWVEHKEGIRSMINARAETVSEKPFFSGAFKQHRCLVLADGFYEWKRGEKSKVPYRITLKTEEPFAMAGIFTELEDETGKKIPSYAILTTSANPVMAKIHNRMPVILSKKLEDDWLDASLEPKEAQRILEENKPSPIRVYEVSKAVNTPRHNTAALLKPRNGNGL